MNNEKVFLTISMGKMELTSQLYGLREKFKNARNNGFTIDQINELSFKIYSSLSNIKKC